MKSNDVSKEMPRYQSHKIVHALKIDRVVIPTGFDQKDDGSRMLIFKDADYAPIRVDRKYVEKHNPQPDGYYVVYPDGYESWSPAEAFESGYIRLE